MTSKAQQIKLDNALVAPKNHLVIGKCSMRINPEMKPKEPAYQVVLDALVLTTYYPAFLIIAEVPVIYMHQFWDTVNKHKASYRFKIDNKKFSMNVEVFRDIINIYPRISGQEFDEPPSEEEALTWLTKIDNIDFKKQDKMFYHRFTKIIIRHFLEKDKSILMRNRTFMHTTRDDSLLGTMRFISRHADFKVYGAILPEAMTNQALLDSVAYKTYYAIASGAEPPKSRKSQKKLDLTISSKESPSKKKSAKAKKFIATKPKPTKKKAPVKADRGKGLNVLSEVALSKAAQLKEATKRSKKEFHTSHASGSRVSDVPEYDSKSDKESWGDSEEDDDDDEDDIEDDEGNDASDVNDDYDDDNNDGNEDADMTNADQGGVGQQNVSQESGFEQVEEDAHVTLTPVFNTQKTDGPVQSSSVSFDFTSKLLNLENPSLDNNEIASLMDTIVHHEEPGSQTLSLYTVPIMVVPEITSVFTTTIPPPPPFFNPLPQQATPALTPTTSVAITSFPSLLDFLSVFKFNDRITNLEKDLSEIKQVDQYAQALSSIPVIILPQAVSDFATPMIEKNVTKSLEVTDLERSSSQPKSTYEADASLSEGVETTEIKIKTPLLDQTEGQKEGSQARKLSRPEIQGQRKKSLQAALKTPPTLNISLLASLPMQRSQVIQLMTRECNRIKSSTRTWISQVAGAKEPTTSFDELINTPIEFSAFVLNQLNIKDLTQAILVGPTFDLLKGTCKSLTELEYHLEECSKATTERLDWHNPEGKPYPFDLSKPLPLILDHRGRQVIPRDFFINNDLEYLKGEDLSRRYSTSVTKIKAATYEIKWTEDLFAANMSSSKDVYSKKQIIAVTRLTIMKNYDYGHLEEIDVRREDQKLYIF
ncbi:hypothetical protein Tco_0386043 [Tanacetum coccineum]